MKLEHLKKMDRIMKKAGTRDPDAVLSSMGFICIDPGNSLPGFITRRKGFVYYGVNRNFSRQKYAFASFHEAFHAICGHLDTPGFLQDGAHADSFLEGHAVAITERDANIGAADALIEPEVFLEMCGFFSGEVKSYLASLSSFEKAVEDYQNHFDTVIRAGSPQERIRKMKSYREELSRLYERLQEQAADLAGSGQILSRPEMARELEVPEYVIDYKTEAMSIRNYNIPRVDLPSYDKVFRKW